MAPPNGVKGSHALVWLFKLCDGLPQLGVAPQNGVKGLHALLWPLNRA